ncbi:hypothetical protein [Sphingobium bisphenolivorans]|uniref:hypothetical protein n=1 Tax=Sphingobium bisphenolivorans TaxID=1335760 RepID=UPI0003A48F69|nr:hypothetical protein [Sphingobium bisphenolivorans]
MQFLQDFHTEFSKALADDRGRLSWRIEPEVFEHLKSLAKSQGTIIAPDSLILFLPYEIGSTHTGTIELLRK